MGCGQTLFLGAAGYITCGYVECPDPESVSTILDDREAEHAVTLRDTDFTVKHPLRERIGDALLQCDLHARITEEPKPPHPPGRYRVTYVGIDQDSASYHDDGYHWEHIGDLQ